MARPLKAQTYYRLDFANPQGHLVEVTARFESGAFGPEETILMPVWTPGSYLVREYARNVESLTAQNAQGQPLPVRRARKDGWAITCGGKSFSVRYRLYANELTVRTPHITAQHAFLPPASALMYHPALAGQLHEVSFGQMPQGWTTVSVALPRKGSANTFTARNLDELIDSPFEAGSHQEQAFEADGTQYRLATFPATERPTEAQLAAWRKVVLQVNALFGSKPPMAEYLFITHIGPGLGGGLEHMASTALETGDRTLKDSAQFESFLQLVAHEYFHLWNVKRIRPHRLGPFDYQAENYTQNLWFAEGITSYYDNLLVARAGYLSPQRFIAEQGGLISNVASQAGASVQSLEDASFDAWVKYYRPNENSPNATVSYYTQGAALGMAIDWHIRALTKGAKSLDDLMRLAWARAQASQDFYINRPSIIAMLSEVCGSDQTAWLTPLVASPTLPDFEALAQACGITVIDRAAGKFFPSIGAATAKAPGAPYINYIRRGGSAEQAGLMFQDQIVAINGQPIKDPIIWDEMPYTEGQVLTVSIVRQGQPQDVPVIVENNPRRRLELVLPKRTPKELKGWIK